MTILRELKIQHQWNALPEALKVGEVACSVPSFILS